MGASFIFEMKAARAATFVIRKCVRGWLVMEGDGEGLPRRCNTVTRSKISELGQKGI